MTLAALAPQGRGMVRVRSRPYLWAGFRFF